MGNYQELAHKINFLINNQKLHEQMSINARKDAEDRFDLNKQAQKYLDWYKEILCHHKSL